MTVDIERIQAQLHAAVALSHEAVEVPPFICYFNPDSDATYANSAVPSSPPNADLDDVLAQVATTFYDRGRQPRFEYLEAYAPGLGATLERNGYRCEMRSLLMVCTRTTLTQPPAVAGLTVERLDESAAPGALQDFVTIQSRAFGDANAAAATPEEAVRFQERFAAVQKFLARLDGVAVGTASLTAPHDRIAELAGIGTLQGYRCQGIAAAATFVATTAALAEGIDQVFLTAADEAAGRVYARAGFQTCGSGVSYLLERVGG